MELRNLTGFQAISIDMAGRLQRILEPFKCEAIEVKEGLFEQIEKIMDSAFDNETKAEIQ